jgi:hypothetical protein
LRIKLCIVILLCCCAQAHAWTKTQVVHFADCTVSPCTGTLSSTGSGHLLVDVFADNSTSGTMGAPPAAACNIAWVHGSNGVPFVNTDVVDLYYCLNSASGVTAFSQPVVPSGGTVSITVYEATQTASTIIAKDSGATPAGTVSDTTCTNCAGVPLTLSGNNNFIVVMSEGTGTITALTGAGFTFDVETSFGDGIGSGITTGSLTAPTTWTSTSGTLGAYAIAFQESGGGGGGGTLWSGVISSNRAIDWSSAGVVGGIPDANWAQCGSTIAAYGTTGTPASPATINNAIAACGASHFVSLGTGTFVLNAKIDFAQHSNVVLRGAGADQTIVRFTAGGATGCIGLGGAVCIFNGDNFVMHPSGLPNSASWTAGYAQGTTSVTLANTINLKIGSLLALWQADPASDPGTIWNCQNSGVLGDCSQQGGLSGPTGNSQVQIVTVTAIPGGGAGGSVGITPGLYSQIWSSGSTPTAGWVTDLPIQNDGVENLTLDSSLATDGTPGSLIFFAWATNCWVTGVRFINTGNPSYQNSVWTYESTHLQFQNNYVYGARGGSGSYGIEIGWPTFDSLVVNNIAQNVASPWMTTGGAGNVFAYNFATDNFYTANGTAPNWEQSDTYADHQDGTYFNLYEGNVGAKLAGDDIHGTAWMNTEFRNYWTGRDGPFKTQSTMVADLEAGNRYYNIIGNVMGESGYHTTYKDIPASNVDNTGCNTTGNVTIYALGWAGATGCNFGTVYNDVNISPFIYLWGNYDVVTAAVRWCGNSSNTGWSTTCASTSEVPTGLSSYAETIPANQLLPTSFYYSAKPSWYNDGIGHTNVPYPAIGPDVSGSGPGGFTNAIPAQLAFKNTVYDTNYSISDTITGITESGTTATITLGSSAPASFTQYQSFWITGSNVAGYNRLWQIATVAGTTLTFTAYAGLGTASGGSATVNAVHSFNANTAYSPSGSSSAATQVSPIVVGP